MKNSSRQLEAGPIVGASLRSDNPVVPPRTGALIINADDWGRDRETTDRTLDCIRAGSVSAVSAMVFMEDSERAAAVAREHGIDTGLHLNFTTPFTTRRVPQKVREHQENISRFLMSHRFAQVLYHPSLSASFDYVIDSQTEEYSRTYGDKPKRMDGHHHMHLCANVLMGNLMPEGTIVRRSFSFFPEEKSIASRSWRKLVNSLLARHHRTTDFFFSLPPINPSRLQPILSLASRWIVELETHPINSDEYLFLTAGGISSLHNSVQLDTFSRCFRT